MGVSWVINVLLDEGKSAQQMVESISQRITVLGGMKDCAHTVDCDVYQSQLPQVAQTVCNLMHNSDYPATAFAILNQDTCISADNTLDMIMLKLKHLYEPRTVLRTQCSGVRYTLDDFAVRIGTVVTSQANNVLGILLEVEYLPSSMAKNCCNLMKEFTQGILGQSVDIPNHIKQKCNGQYTPADTMHQYLELFNTLKRAQIQSQAQS